MGGGLCGVGDALHRTTAGLAKPPALAFCWVARYMKLFAIIAVLVPIVLYLMRHSPGAGLMTTAISDNRRGVD